VSILTCDREKSRLIYRRALPEVGLGARQSAGQPAVGLSSASLFSALTRLPAPLATGAIAQSFSLPVAFATFAVALGLAAAGVGAFASGRDAPATKL
jgi:hypothetical protein